MRGAHRYSWNAARPVVLAVVMLGAVLVPQRTGLAARPPTLSAQQIVAKNVAARGGLEAWRKVESMVWLGHIDSVHSPAPSVRFVLAQQRPNKTHFEINAMGDRTLRIFDGSQGWKLHPVHGRPVLEAYSADEVRFAQGGPQFDGLLMGYADRGIALKVEGIDEIDKRDAYRLTLHTASGETQQLWVDAQTFLEVRYDRPSTAAGGDSRTISVVYRDYQATDGLKFPSVIETGVGPGVAPDRMVIEKVLLNPPMDPHAFNQPKAPGAPTRSPAALPRAHQASPPASPRRTPPEPTFTPVHPPTVPSTAPSTQAPPPETPSESPQDPGSVPR